MSLSSKLELVAEVLSWILNFIPTAFSTICPTFIYNRIRWCPTSEEQLKIAETKIFLNLKQPYQEKFVSIGKCFGKKETFIKTICLNETANKTPIVLLHGFACAIGVWVKNLDALSSHRPVYALDLLGFGRSSRPPFSNDAVEAEMQYFISLEKWRSALGLQKFILLGHGLGGYLAASYTLHYPERVSLLILEDPWGFEEKPIAFPHHYEIDAWVKVLDKFYKGFNYLSVVRGSGVLGPLLVNCVRQDFLKKFAESLMEPTSILDYLYHCNAQTPSGEAAFKALADSAGYPKHSMYSRINSLDSRIPISLVYGSRSWINRTPGLQIKYSRLNAFVEVQVVEGAGHHVHADKPDDFNNLINTICDNLEIGLMGPDNL